MFSPIWMDWPVLRERTNMNSFPFKKHVVTVVGLYALKDSFATVNLSAVRRPRPFFFKISVACRFFVKVFSASY
jgi:hypothetical protein